MDYKTLSVKTFIEDMNGKEVMMKSVPSLTKYPLKLFYKKTVGDIVNLVRSKKLVPEEAIQAFIADVEALYVSRLGVIPLPSGRGIFFALFGLHNADIQRRPKHLRACAAGAVPQGRHDRCAAGKRLGRVDL